MTIGRLAADEKLKRTSGAIAWLVRPVLDLELLDAVVVLVPRDRPQSPSDGVFAESAPTALSCALLSTWRDGGAVVGDDVTAGGAVVVDERFAGTIDDSLFGAARVRGVFDPGRRLHVLVIGRNVTYPARLQVSNKARDRARLSVIAVVAGHAIAPGDVLVTAGRGAHVPRGLVIGEVIGTGADWVEVATPAVSPGAPVRAFERVGYPKDYSSANASAN